MSQLQSLEQDAAALYIYIVDPDGRRKVFPVDHARLSPNSPYARLSVGSDIDNNIILRSNHVASYQLQVSMEGQNASVVVLDEQIVVTWDGSDGLALPFNRPTPWPLDTVLFVGGFQLLLSRQVERSTAAEVPSHRIADEAVDEPAPAPEKPIPGVARADHVAQEASTVTPGGPPVSRTRESEEASGTTGGGERGPEQVELIPLQEEAWQLSGGESRSAEYRIVNGTARDDSFRLQVTGLPSGWATPSPPQPIKSGGQDEAAIQYTLPGDGSVVAGTYPFEIRALGLAHRRQSNLLRERLVIPEDHSFSAYLVPASARLGTTISVQVKNRGNVRQTFDLAWHDTTGELNFSPPGGTLTLAPAETAQTSFTATRGTRIPGLNNENYPIRVEITPARGSSQIKQGRLKSTGCLMPCLVTSLLLPILCLGVVYLTYSGTDWWDQIQNFVAELFPGPDTEAEPLPAEAPSPFEAPEVGDSPDPLETIDVSQQRLDEQATRSAGALATAVVEETQKAQAAIVATQQWNERDEDKDGLRNGDELYTYYTSPYHWDTDQDGLSDLYEIELATDPRNPDTDYDYCVDGDEIRRNLDPLNPDTDGDGILDGFDPSPGST